MTWKEFKDEIDRQMVEQKIPEDAEIRFIEVSYPTRKPPSCIPELVFDGKFGITISNPW